MSQSILDQFGPLFAPKTVAVVGASTKGTALPNVFMRRIREFGYTGEIYPIHPSAAEIDGLHLYHRCHPAAEDSNERCKSPRRFGKSCGRSTA